MHQTTQSLDELVRDPPEGGTFATAPLDRLLLDDENPRLPRFAEPPLQGDLEQLIVRKYPVNEILDSLAVSGFFKEEALVTVPAGDKHHLIVVEGNRRLVALRLIANPERARQLRVGLPALPAGRTDELKEIPVSIHPTRAEVLPYLGFRHITGVMPWDSYSKARYVAQMVERGESLQVIQRRIGDRHETAPRLYRAYLQWEQLNGDQFRDVEGNPPPFSYLFTALTFRPVLQFLGLSAQGAPQPVNARHRPSWYV